MKKLIFTFMAILIGLSSYCQTYKTTTLIEQRNYYLNGGARSYMGGKSRVTIKIDLPANTKRWYYSFSTSPGENGTQMLNLGMQVAATMSTGGLGAAVASSIQVPSGSGAVDILVLPTEYASLFLNKDDGSWKFYGDVSLQNSRQAVQSIDNNYGNSFYLGLRNPSAMDGINIFIEVVAIVEEVSAEADKGMLYGNLGWKAFERGEYDKCVEYSTKALTYNPNLCFCKFNIALTHLQQEKDSSIDEYVDAISSLKNDKNPKATLEGAIQDTDNLKAKDPTLKNLNDIQEILKDAYNKY